MSKGIFDKRFATHIPSDSAYHTLLCTNELGYVEADVNYKITGIPQESILFGYTTAGNAGIQGQQISIAGGLAFLHKLYVSACLSDLNGYMEVLLVSYGGLGGTVTDQEF